MEKSSENPTLSEAVIAYDIAKLKLSGNMTDAKYVTTTEVYPDSPKTNPEECIQAQVAAITGGLDYLIRYAALLICVFVLSFSSPSHASNDDSFDDRETHGSFVSFEVGPTYILSDGGTGAGDLIMIHFNVGFTFNKFFRLTWENENFTFGPRIGLGFGQPSPTADKRYFMTSSPMFDSLQAMGKPCSDRISKADRV
ncbi:MAG: hypothetical protein R2877_08035 [Bdellovibrionota bacterium]